MPELTAFCARLMMAWFHDAERSTRPGFRIPLSCAGPGAVVSFSGSTRSEPHVGSRREGMGDMRTSREFVE